MTYAEHRQRQHEYEHAKFAALSAGEQLTAWRRREAWLWTYFLQLDKKWVNPTVGCPRCQGSYGIVAPSWPAFFECVCLATIILDRWLPDGIERITIATPEELREFARTGAKLYDLYNYPLEERIRDLRTEGDRGL